MLQHYYIEREIAERERRLRSALARANGEPLHARSRAPRRRPAAGMARVLRSVADRLDG